MGQICVRADLENDLAAVLHRHAKLLIPGNVIPGGFRHRPDGYIQPFISVGPTQDGGLHHGNAADIQPPVAVQRNASLVLVRKYNDLAGLPLVIGPHQNPGAGQQILIRHSVAGKIGFHLRVLPHLIHRPVGQGDGHTAPVGNSQTRKAVRPDDHIVLRNLVVRRDIHQKKLRCDLRGQAHGHGSLRPQPRIDGAAVLDGLCIYRLAADGVQDHNALRPQDIVLRWFSGGRAHQQAAVLLMGNGSRDHGILRVRDVGPRAGGANGCQSGDAQHSGAQSRCDQLHRKFHRLSSFLSSGSEPPEECSVCLDRRRAAGKSSHLPQKSR